MKAKMKVLFEEGNFNALKPWAFGVWLRRWISETAEDFIVEVGYTIDKVNVSSGISNYFVEELETFALSGVSEGEAIRTAVAVYDYLAGALYDNPEFRFDYEQFARIRDRVMGYLGEEELARVEALESLESLYSILLLYPDEKQKELKDILDDFAIQLLDSQSTK